MATHRKHVLKGSKISRSHTTYIESAEPVIVAAKKYPEVTKISLGLISQAKSAISRIHCREIPAGLKVTVRGVRQVQTLYVYTSTPKETARKLESL